MNEDENSWNEQRIKWGYNAGEAAASIAMSLPMMILNGWYRRHYTTVV